MLILGRREGEEIVIGGMIRVCLVRGRDGKGRIGISAPAGVPVHRPEVLATHDDLTQQHAEFGRQLRQLLGLPEPAADADGDELPAVGAPAVADLQRQDDETAAATADHVDQASELAAMLGLVQFAEQLEVLTDFLRGQRQFCSPPLLALTQMAWQLEDSAVREQFCGWMPSAPAEVARTLRELAGQLATVTEGRA